MSAAQFLKTRVSSEMKARVRSLAKQELITESVWLKRLVMSALREARKVHNDHHPGCESMATALTERAVVTGRLGPQVSRICVRLGRDDQALLRERADARGLRAATYVSVLVRAHLRRLTPLPREELLVLKRCVAELGALGRSINQIARATHLGAPVSASRDHLEAMLRISEALRDNVKELVRANTRSWEVGHDDTER